MLCYYVTLYEELGFFLKEKAALHPTALLCNHLDKILFITKIVMDGHRTAGHLLKAKQMWSSKYF